MFLDNESVQQNDLKQQIISILGYAEEDNSLARAIIGSKKISSEYLLIDRTLIIMD